MATRNLSRKAAPKGKDYANRSVLTGASLLRSLSKLGGGATLQEIASANGMLLARTHRYLLSLVKSGLVDYDKNSGHYELGSLVLELGLTALDRLDAVRMGSDIVRGLAERLDRTVLLSVWGSNGATIVKCEMARRNRINQRREGVNLPLLTSATGRIFFAYLPRRETLDFLSEQTTGEAAPADAIPAPGVLENLRAEIRRVGIARNAGGTRLDALAAPVFNYEGRLVMVLTIVADAQTVDMSIDSGAARELRSQAEALSRQLGAGGSRLRSSSAA